MLNNHCFHEVQTETDCESTLNMKRKISHGLITQSSHSYKN